MSRSEGVYIKAPQERKEELRLPRESQGRRQNRLGGKGSWESGKPLPSPLQNIPPLQLLDDCGRP